MTENTGEKQIFLTEEDTMEYIEKKRSSFFGLPWTFTTYKITDELITITTGLFRKVEDDAYMYKIVDVRMDATLWQRILGLSTIHCYGGDVTNPDLMIKNIKHGKEIKDFIFSQSEKERLKRRTLNTQNIDGGPAVPQMAAGPAGPMM